MTTTSAPTKTALNPTAIRSVGFYTASPVECCDRCGQGIKYVALVSLKDGSVCRYGMDCINKILSGDTSLKGLFAKNAKLLKLWTDSLAILTRAESDMPRGCEYYDSGIYFIGGEDGKDLRAFRGCGLFHPLSDFEKNLGGDKYTMDGSCTRYIHGVGNVPNTPENFQIDCRQNIAKAKIFYEAEITRISGFLARVLAKGLVAPVVS